MIDVTLVDPAAGITDVLGRPLSLPVLPPVGAIVDVEGTPWRVVAPPVLTVRAQTFEAPAGLRLTAVALPVERVR